MVKIAGGAGHYLDTPGKRCSKSLDKNETREWFLNDRIVDHIENMLKEYEGVEFLRLEDTTGKKDIGLEARTDKANAWGADILISNHHNAGIKGGSGGGITVYRHPVTPQITKDYQKAMYDKLIKHTGLRGNRSQPLGVADHHMTRESNMPALLIENGFMDSRKDVPIILTAEFALSSAKAQVEFLVETFDLKKKPKPKPKPKSTDPDVFYRVVTGSFGDRQNALGRVEKLEKAGFDSFITVYKK